MSARVYLPEGGPSGRYPLSREEAQHAARVLRIREGDPLEFVNGNGLHGRGILRWSGRAAELEVIDAKQEPPPPDRSLCISVLKGPAMEMVLRKTVELGLRRLEVVQMDQAVGRLPPPEQLPERWTRQWIEGMKQSGNPWLPELRLFPSLQAWLASDPGDGWWWGDCRPGASSIPAPKAAPVLRGICIGPEGDFSRAEREALGRTGWPGVSLGRWTLRAETAMLVAGALLTLLP